MEGIVTWRLRAETVLYPVKMSNANVFSWVEMWNLPSRAAWDPNRSWTGLVMYHEIHEKLVSDNDWVVENL